MRRLFIFFLTGYLLTDASDVFSQINKNWTSTEVYNGNGEVVGQAKVFTDNFGRHDQSLTRIFSTNQLIINNTLYDALGNASISSLPFPVTYNNLDYKPGVIKDATGNNYSALNFDGAKTFLPDAVGKQAGTVGWYYSNANTTDEYVPGTDFPYTRGWREINPDPRSGKITMPGDQFRLGNNKEYSTQLLKISTGELSHYYSLRHYFTPVNVTLNQDAAYQTISTDPDGKKNVTYTDAEGKVLVTAIIDEGVYKDHSYTYYNDIGQIVATVGPKGVDTLSPALPSYVTYFYYNEWGQLTKVITPDEGASEFIYGLDGRIRFSQNAEQAARGTSVFSYTHYDATLRPIESGEYAGGVLDFGGAALSDMVEQSERLWQDEQVKDWTKITYDQPASDFPADATHTAQSFTWGMISTTENENTKTWYSYDELGRLIFTIQKIKTLNKFITVDYTYNFNGNLLTMAYQKNVAGEAFFHHYEYDQDLRLISVKTSVDGELNNAYLHATYHYYPHGPLKRVELATDLQGVDYVYTAQGALKAINHPDNNLDPGNDGTNGFKADVFGMTLEYFEGDYNRSGITSIDMNETFVKQNFNNNIRALSYGKNNLNLAHLFNDHLVLDQFDPLKNDQKARSSITLKAGFDTGGNTFDGGLDPLGTYTLENQPSKLYAHDYDTKNQLSKAIYDEKTAFDYSSNQNRIDNLTYDKNGNIKTLTRFDDNSQVKHDFTYHYPEGKNRLSEITGYATYSYDAAGRVEGVDYTEGDDVYLQYNTYGLVTALYSDAARTNLRVSFLYNERGHRLMKKNHDTGIETWYIRDVTGNILSLYYRYQGELFQAEIPLYGMGRIGIAYRNTSHYKYNYEINDHLGNVRAVVSKLKFMETATMEPTLALLEEQAFENVASSRWQDAMFNHTDTEQVPGASHAAWLNGFHGRTTGPAKSLKVTAGDKITMEVFANYVDPAATNNLVGGIGAMVAGSFGFALDNESANYFIKIQNAMGGPAAITGLPANNAPKAYMQYLFFDNNFNYVTSIPVENTYRMISEDARVTVDALGNVISVPHERLYNEIVVPQDGYMFIYIVNESSENINIYFDDLTITQTGIDIVKNSDYYPFGSILYNWQKEEYRHGYQGQFSEKDEETGWNNFELRMYDPIIGRWLMPDPYPHFPSPYNGMGNNPMMVDPNGAYPFPSVYVFSFLDGRIIVPVGEVASGTLSLAPYAVAVKFSSELSETEFAFIGSVHGGVGGGAGYFLSTPNAGPLPLPAVISAFWAPSIDAVLEWGINVGGTHKRGNLDIPFLPETLSAEVNFALSDNIYPGITFANPYGETFGKGLGVYADVSYTWKYSSFRIDDIKDAQLRSDLIGLHRRIADMQDGTNRALSGLLKNAGKYLLNKTWKVARSYVTKLLARKIPLPGPPRFNR